MTAYEASKEWQERFCQVPTKQVIEAKFCQDGPEIFRLGKKMPKASWPCIWRCLYSPKDDADHTWILQNIETVEDCGFVVYQSEQGFSLLGVDSYTKELVDFYFYNLYMERGLMWHKKAG